MALKDAKFPAFYWGPDGQRELFTSAAEVPTGWTDTHPKHYDGQKPPPGPKTTAPVIPMTKAEIVAELKAANIPYQNNIGQQAAYNLLVGELKKHLTEASIPFPETADGPALLALVKPKE